VRGVLLAAGLILWGVGALYFGKKNEGILLIGFAVVLAVFHYLIASGEAKRKKAFRGWHTYLAQHGREYDGYVREIVERRTAYTYTDDKNNDRISYRYSYRYMVSYKDAAGTEITFETPCINRPQKPKWRVTCIVKTLEKRILESVSCQWRFP
jgi:hypothetical protein